jgi:hypothetical protein
MDQKYAHVLPVDEVLAYMARIGGAQLAVAR